MLQQVYARLRWLNDWDEVDLERELAKAQARQEDLSARAWTLDISFLRSYGVR